MTANVTDPKLTPKQRKAVEALLVTGDVTAAAREAGVSRESVYRWLKQPLFLEAVREAEARALDELSRLLVRLGRTAATTLAKAMSEESTPVATLEARVAELERAAGLQTDQGWER